MSQVTPPFDHHADADGFTLVEILVAITLLGLVVALVHGGVRLGTAAWDTSHDLLEAHDDVVVTRDLLERLVGSASPSVHDSSNREIGAFVGGRRGIAFLANSPVQSLSTGRYRVTISEQRRDDAVDLVLSLELLDGAPPNSASSPRPDSKVLLKDVKVIEFSYLPVGMDRNTDSWAQDWEGTGALPALVRIDIQFAPADRRAWYPLIVEPMVHVADECAAGPPTQACEY
jgi:general secretion pathway protein J